jgi:outer membrane protein OmpA-like peptidoglycan-associated protein
VIGDLIARFIHAISFYDLAVMVIPALIAFVGAEILAVWIVLRRLRTTQYRLPSFRVISEASGWWSASKYLVVLLLSLEVILRSEKIRWQGVVIGFCLAISGAFLALTSGDYGIFGSAGALVTVVALYSELWGSRQEGALPNQLAMHPQLKEKLAQAGYTEKRRASLWVFATTVLGTLIWAYGDILLQKVAGPLDTMSTTHTIEGKAPKVDPNVFTASISDSALQRLLPTVESALRDLQTLHKSPPITTQDIREIKAYLNNIDTGLRKIVPKTTGAASPDPNQDSRSRPTSTQSYSVFFDSGQVGLTAVAQRLIAEAAENAANAKSVLCNGYSDVSGNFAANLRLSVQRASNVAIELIRDGVPADVITIKGYGPQQAGRMVRIAIQ